MNAKDLLQSLKSCLERDSQLTETDFQIHIQVNQNFSKATLAFPVEGKVHLFQAVFVDLGIQDGVSILC